MCEYRAHNSRPATFAINLIQNSTFITFINTRPSVTVGLQFFLNKASFPSMSLVLSRVCQWVEIFCSWWTETLNQPKALRSRVPTAMSSWKDGLKPPSLPPSLPPFLDLSALPDHWLGSCLTSPHVELQRKDFHAQNLENIYRTFL